MRLESLQMLCLASVVVSGVSAGACTDAVTELARVSPAAEGAGGAAQCTVGGRACALGCDLSLGCVDCIGDSDCGAATPRCILGKCGACATSIDCPAGQACFPKDRTCHTRCSDSAPCTTGDQPICDAATGACVGCTSNDDCTDVNKPICEPTRSQCGQCATRSDCGAAAPACDIPHGQCTECLIDEDCPRAELCAADHHCHGGCASSADCTDPSKPVCSTATHTCVACLTGSDCAAPTPICKDATRCVECGSDADCAADRPRCKDNACVVCVSDTDCPPAAPICVNAQCTASPPPPA